MMTKYHDPGEYLEAARSLDTPPEELEYLASSEYSFVRTAIARNPNVTAEILAFLVPQLLHFSNEQELAVALAENPRATAQTLNVLGERLIPYCSEEYNLAFKAGVCLCTNPLTDLEVIRAMLNPDTSTRQFRKVVARETSRKDVLQLLATDKSGLVKERALKRLQELHLATSIQ